MFNPNQLDLNLLRVFAAVMQEGSITRAGARLGLTQPAASNALKRLRAYCSDPLFVWSTEARLVRAMGADSEQRRVALRVQHFLVMPMILAESRLLAVVPQTIADTFRPFLDLRIFALPYKAEPIHVKQFWHRRSQHDAGHRWLRNEIGKAYVR